MSTASITASVLTVDDDLTSKCHDDVCWVLTTCRAPFIIRAVSPTWCETWGWHAQEAVGNASTAILNGPGTDTAAAEVMMRAFFEGTAWHASARLTNRTKGAELLTHDFILLQHPAGQRRQRPLATGACPPR